MNSKELLEHMTDTYNECIRIAEAKNSDYATNNDAFRNFKVSEIVGVPSEQGIMVRMMDKMARVANGLTSDYKVKDETINDTLNDLINYAAILKAYVSAYDLSKKE